MTKDFRAILADGGFIKPLNGKPINGEPLYIEIYTDVTLTEEQSSVIHGFVSGYENLIGHGNGVTQREKDFAASSGDLKAVYLGFNNCSCPYVAQIIGGFITDPNTGETRVLFTASNDRDDGHPIKGRSNREGKRLGVSAELVMNDSDNVIVNNGQDGWKEIDVQLYQERKKGSFLNPETRQQEDCMVVTIAIVDNAADKVTPEKAYNKTLKRGAEINFYYPICDDSDPKKPQYEQIPAMVIVKSSFRSADPRLIDVEIGVTQTPDGRLTYSGGDPVNAPTDTREKAPDEPYLGAEITGKLSGDKTEVGITYYNEPEVAVLSVPGVYMQEQEPKKDKGFFNNLFNHNVNSHKKQGQGVGH